MNATTIGLLPGVRLVAMCLVTSCGVVGLTSCTHAPATSTPTVATPAANRPAPTASGAPPVAGRRRVPPSRDSVVKLRAVYVAQIMTQIAGRENLPAEQVFKNLQVLKGITAAELVRKMDEDYATAMSWNCTNCHRLAPQDNFASDTSNDKRRARFMQQMQNDINANQLPKLYLRRAAKWRLASERSRPFSRRCQPPRDAFHAANTSASFVIAKPFSPFPWSTASCSACGRVLCQSSVSFAVTATGRNVSPLAIALLALRR